MQKVRLQANSKDKMTPWERQNALERGESADRLSCIPFMSELKCVLSGVSVWDFWHDPEKMAEAETAVFNRFGYDRIVLGPNTRGITEMLGGRFVYPEEGVPFGAEPFLRDYAQLDELAAVEISAHPRLRTFLRAAEILAPQAEHLVPLEMSIGGPLTIASNLRGIEPLMMDCRRRPEQVTRLLRIAADAQKRCIDAAAEYGMGIAMADPVANPGLIGPKRYEQFVFPLTRELTAYALEKTGKKVSLHMCGDTRSIWKFFRQYPLHEISLDNIIDLDQAVRELGDAVPIAGNVDPVEIMLNGTEAQIRAAAVRCMDSGRKAPCGFHLATGCDLPETTDPAHVEVLMDAARNYFHRK